MRIGKTAKWGMMKKFDENREMAIAVDGQGNKQFYVKCLARDFRENRQKDKDGKDTKVSK